MRHFIIHIAILLAAILPGIQVSAQFSPRSNDAAEQQPPVTWRANARLTAQNEGIITITATMAPGWHLYGTEMPADGPRATTFTYHTDKGWKLSGKTVADRKAVSKHDTMFNITVQYWEGKVVFTQRFTLNDKANRPESIRCTIDYMGCNDQTCLPPKKKEFTLKILPKK